MIIYNVTINVENAIVEEWKTWMKTVHIPNVMATNLFLEHKFLKLLQETEDDKTTTFAVQYFLSDMEQFQKYLSEFASEMRQEVLDKYGERVLAFRTLLEVID